MGIDLVSARFLSLMGQSGVSFERTIMLGRQDLFGRGFQFGRALRDTGKSISDEQASAIVSHRYAESLFKFLGALSVDSMDATNYEGATQVHDLNQPLPDDLRCRFSAVFDGGTLEHVFDFPRAISNAMAMVEVGGHFLSITTANNFCGHGFFQFSPELFFRVFSEENGFIAEGVFLHELSYRRDHPIVWQVRDPAELGRRVNVRSAKPTFIMVRAKKLSDVSPFQKTPQQSDYSVKWEGAPPEQAISRRSDKGRAVRHALKAPTAPLSDAWESFKWAVNPLLGQAGSAKQLRLDESFLSEFKP